jgi:hypothetical protein
MQLLNIFVIVSSDRKTRLIWWWHRHWDGHHRDSEAAGVRLKLVLV